MTSYQRIVDRAWRMVAVLALLLGALPIDTAAAHTIDSIEALPSRSITVASAVSDQIETVRQVAATFDRNAGSAPQAPSAVSITAAKSDALLVDSNHNTFADPGDALRYTVVIRNSGSTDAAGVVFTDTIDDNTVLSGTVRATPLALTDVYSAYGNIPITIAAPGVLGNDFFGNPSATLTPIVSGTTAQGGTINLNADGSFTYNPPPGFEGTDTFNYTLNNAVGSDVGTVTFNIGGMIWFIDSSFGGTSDGRFTNPFKTVGTFQSVNDGTGNHPAANDTIYIYDSGSTYTSAAVTLLANQRLLGEGVSLAAELGTLPTGSPAMPGVGTTPTLSNGGSIITLGSGNTVKGLTLSPSSGSGIAGSGSLGTTTVTAVAINLSSTANGVSLSSHTGTFNYTSGSISGSSSGAGVTLSGGTGSASIAASISNSSGRPVNVDSKTGGAVTFSGAVNGTGQGVLLNNNTGATITFSGGVTLNTGANVAFTATGGGTVNVTGSSNTLTTTTGIALNVANTTIGSSGLNFRSISSNGAASGIILNNTGVSGGLTVAGTGTTGSGGTIQNSTDSGLLGTSTANLNLSYMNILNNGNALNEGGIRLINLSGAGSLNSSTVSGGYEDNVYLSNNAGTLTSFTIQGPNCSIMNNNSTQGNTGITALSAVSANSTVVINNCAFSGNRSDTIHVDAGDSATMNATITNNTITAGSPNQGNLGIDVTVANNGVMNFAVENNKVGTNGVTNAPLLNTGINIFNGTLVTSGTPASIVGTVKNNIVVNDNTAAPSVSNGFGIRLFNQGYGTMNVNVSNNTVSNINTDYGIFAEVSSNSGTANAAGSSSIAMINNTSNVLSGALDAIRVQARGRSTMCARISGNSSTTTGSGFSGLTIRQASQTIPVGGTVYQATFNLEGLASGLQTNNALIVGYVSGQNPAVTDGVSEFHTAGITGVPVNSCTSIPAAPSTAPTNSGKQAAEVAPVLSQNDTVSAPSVETIVQPAEFLQAAQIAPADRLVNAPIIPLSPITPFNIGALPAGKTITLTFDVTINDPIPDGVTQVSNQGAVSGSGFTTVLTDDPDTGALNDPTVTPLNIVSDIQLLSKSDGGITATPGQQFGYSLVYTNAGPQGAVGVVLTETVPANTTYTGSGWNCIPNSSAGSICTNSVGLVSRNSGGSAVFTVTVVNPVPAGVTQLSNSASIGTSVVDPDLSNNTASDTTPVNAAPDLAISKSDGGTSVTPGGTVAYTLNYSNAGNQGATGVVLTETVPANTTFNAGASSAGWSCTNGSAAGTTCVLTIGALNGGGASGARTFAVTVVNQVVAGVDQITNTASIADDGSNGADPTPGNNSTSDTTPVNAAPDLTLTKNDGGITIVPGGIISYSLAVSNVGNQGATGVLITETVPANAVFNPGASTPIGNWSCAPNNNAGSTCRLGGSGSSIPAGGFGTAVFAVTVVNPVPAGVTQISNTASVGDDGSNGADPTPANNTASDTTPVTAAPDLQLSKSDGGVRGIPGGNVVYTLAYTNTGNQGATGIALTDTVPANTTFAAAASTIGWSCADGAAAGTICTLNQGGVNGGGSSSAAAFAVKVDNPFPLSESAITNTASIADDGVNGADATPGNNIATDSTPIDNVPDMTIAKTHTGNFTKGQVGATYTIQVSNAGGMPTSGTVTVTDALPVGLTATGLSGSGWTCNVGALTCTRSDVLNTSASYPDITLTVDVAVNAASTLTNTATVSGGGESNTTNDTANDITSINRAASTTAVTSNPNPSVFGQNVTFTAIVTSSVGTPTGVVTFTEGVTTLGTGTLSGGVATFSTSALSRGSHNVTATYGGDGNFNTSNDVTTQVVNQANSATTLTSAPNPSVFGQSVTFTATVSASAPGAGTPTGVVTFTEGVTTLGTGTLSGGVATFNTSALSVGSHNVTATYGGDSNFNASSNSTTQVVNQANSATALTSAPNPSVFGQSVTFTATVSASAPGAGTPTGVVTFTEGVTTLGIGTLSGGVATFNTSALSVGSHNVTATYSGDNNFNGNISNSVTHNVNRAGTSTAITGFTTPAYVGQPITVTYSVNVTTPGAGTPTGIITVTDGSATCVAALPATSCVLTFATPGSKSVTAAYSGDGNFAGSVSSPATSINVQDVPIVGLTAVNSSPTGLGNPTFFTATISAGTNALYTWNFGDGSPLGSGANTSRTYTAVGAYTATVTATNGSNLQVATTVVTVVNQPISGLVAANSSPTRLGSATAFTVTVTTGSSVSYAWDFGDGMTGSGANATHTYAAIGTYTATVTATNVINSQTAATVVVVIDRAIVGLSASNDSPTRLGGTTAFTATIGDGSNVAYQWNFGDGSTSNGANANHVYGAVGAYVATVTATNGVSVAVATTNASVIDTPIVNLAAANSSPTGLGFLTALTATIGSGSNVVYAWNFGDGVSGNGATTSHVYPALGAYTATVTATNGVSNVVATTLVTIVDQPITTLNAVSTSPTLFGNTTFFTATTNGTSIVYAWDFGDGATAGGMTPSHTYTAIGQYMAIVTATNSTGSLTATVKVDVFSGKTYLPLITRNYVSAPDLVVTSLKASTGNVRVMIKNQGDRPVTDGFYVDVYINPHPAPTAVNQIWSDGRSAQGLTWGVTAAMQPGQVLTLTIDDAYYLADYSIFTGTLPIGTPVYAQVDSYDPTTTYGAVRENHEIVGGLYNNILGPVPSTTAFATLNAMQPIGPGNYWLPVRLKVQ